MIYDRALNLRNTFLDLVGELEICIVKLLCKFSVAFIGYRCISHISSELFWISCMLHTSIYIRDIQKSECTIFEISINIIYDVIILNNFNSTYIIVNDKLNIYIMKHILFFTMRFKSTIYCF